MNLQWARMLQAIAHLRNIPKVLKDMSEKRTESEIMPEKMLETIPMQEYFDRGHTRIGLARIMGLHYESVLKMIRTQREIYITLGPNNLPLACLEVRRLWTRKVRPPSAASVEQWLEEDEN